MNNSIRDLWDNIRWSNTYVIGAPEEDPENKVDKISEEIIVKILLFDENTIYQIPNLKSDQTPRQ